MGSQFVGQSEQIHKVTDVQEGHPMNTHTPAQLEFHPFGRRQVVGRFDSGRPVPHQQAAAHVPVSRVAEEPATRVLGLDHTHPLV